MKRSVALEPGVVYQDVDCAEPLPHFGEHRLHFVLAADISAHSDRFAAAALNRFHHAVGLIRIRSVVDYHIRACHPERERAGFADAGVRAGHERLLVFQRLEWVWRRVHDL